MEIFDYLRIFVYSVKFAYIYILTCRKFGKGDKIEMRFEKAINEMCSSHEYIRKKSLSP